MLTRPGRGFTLIELMIATVTMGLVLGSIYQAVLVTQRVARTQGRQLALQSSVRGAVLVVLSELRELSSTDILSLGTSAIAYRAMRGTGFTCAPSSSDQLRIGRSGFSGVRDPQAGRDSMLLYADSAGSGAEPGWIALPITGASRTTACPGSDPGVTLSTFPTTWLAGREAGLPVRIYEPMELRLYQSEGKSWLGARGLGTGEVIQPLFGPLSGQDGFRLSYRDGAGRPTGTATSVRSITASVHGLAQEAGEELTSEVFLRNASP